MPLFALPLAPSSTTQSAQPRTSRVKFSNLPVRNRKRQRTSEETSDDERSSLDGDVAPPATTNPLSLTPLEIAQYQLAGLELNEALPEVNGFPHRALPQEYGAQDKKARERGRRNDEDMSLEREETGAKEEDGYEDEGISKRGPWLRNQHLSVLTTILHRCLGEGDIKRASRAWAMLLRMQIAGRGIDIRSTGYWEIGAGLLVRSLDKKKKFSYDNDESDVEEESAIEEDTGIERRWGSKEGLDLAKSYYERLILEFPYNRQYQMSVSALDFWPAMVGCEIYGVQIEQKEGLRKVAQQEKKDNEDDGSGDESMDSDESEEEDTEGDIFEMNQRRKEKVRQKRAEKRWLERDEVRQTALVASEAIAAKLDEVMTIPPYSDSHNLIRLRGMLALYIGDLSVPTMPLEQDEQDDIADSSRKSRGLSGLDKNTELRFLYRQRVAEYERGQLVRGQQRERAAKLFERIIRDGDGDEDIRQVALGLTELEEQELDEEDLS
ncbi:uncharacterized protein RAG0_10401 [Rhynchosporium agropyri]|uniref:RNA polymerase I-specific transcription initiation factor rrn11 n=1 Tax=Rhynchosporium agropyri TaxID=914238 RepID=A0A1E1KZR1_9HELO|nr:uncharacterized protein RAG0_10401 [Rhynchosporium agropyri]